MSCFLVCAQPFFGHVNPMLQIVKELTARGHRVVFYSEEPSGEAHMAAGAEFRSVAQAPVADGAFKAVRELEVLHQVLPMAREDRPDCVVYDSMSLWGMVLAKALDVPAARVNMHFPITERYHPFDPFGPVVPVKENFAEFEQDMQTAHDLYGVPAMTYHETMFHAEPLNIVPIPEPFVAGREYLDERFHFVGPLFDAPPQEKADGERVIYVSLGSLNNNMPAFYDLCIGALGDDESDREVLISTGQKTDHALFGPIPANVTLQRSVPQLEVLQRTDVFVNHAGLNSVMESLYFGVPMVVVPLTLEQRAIAARIAELRLGAVLDVRSATRHILREMVASVESDPETRAAVDAMRKVMLDDLGGRSLAADLLVDYAESGGGTPR